MSATLRPAPRCPCARAGLPVGAEQCLMCDLDDVQSPIAHRPARPAQAPDAPTFRPPADERCSRCDRILLSAPCGCLTPVEAYLRAAEEERVRWLGLTYAERMEAVKAKAARRWGT